MHSYETVAVLAIAVSAASPALSAPVLESQQHARAGVAAPGGVGNLIKTIGTGLAFGALPAVLQDALGGNSTRRELPGDLGHLVSNTLPVRGNTPDTRRGFLEDFFFNSLPVPDNTPDTRRDLPARIIVDGLPVPDTSGDDDSSDTTPARIVFDGLPAKRDVDIRSIFVGTPFDTSTDKSIVKLGVLPRSQDFIDALELLSRHFDEHALATRSVVSSVLNGLKNTDTVGNVIKNGLISGVASGVGAVGATELLNRREPEPQAENLLSVISLLARELEELD